MKPIFNSDYLDADSTTLGFVSLHDHPGGADGGEFPCFQSLSLEDGKVVYQWDVPESPVDTFGDEDPEDFCFLPTKEDARNKLLDTQERLRVATELVKTLFSALETGDYVAVRAQDTD